MTDKAKYQDLHQMLTDGPSASSASVFSYSTLVLFAGCWIGFRIHRWWGPHRD